MSKMTAPLSIELGILPLSSLNDDPRDIMTRVDVTINVAADRCVGGD